MAFHYIKNFPRYTGIHLFPLLPPSPLLPSSREIKQFKSTEDAATSSRHIYCAAIDETFIESCDGGR